MFALFPGGLQGHKPTCFGLWDPQLQEVVIGSTVSLVLYRRYPKQHKCYHLFVQKDGLAVASVGLLPCKIAVTHTPKKRK